MVARRKLEALRTKARLQGKTVDCKEKQKPDIAAEKEEAAGPAEVAGQEDHRVGPAWDLTRGRAVDGESDFEVLAKVCAEKGSEQAEAVVFCVPDCSTFSRAREIKIPGVLCRQLRSEELPAGFTKGLSERGYKRVRVASEIAEWTAKACRAAGEHGRGFIVENPLG